MSEIRVPDYVPMLRKGTGATPKDGGCLVQVAGWLYDGQSWRDDVECVHPVLRRAGIVVNDRVSDEERHRLALLAPRISGSADAVSDWSDGERHKLAVRLAVFCARSVLDLVRPKYRAAFREAVDLADAWTRGEVTSDECRTAAYAVADAAYAAAADAAADAAYAAAYAANAANAAYAAANAAYAAANAAYAVADAAYAAANAASLVDWYASLVDEYDRLTGRTTEPLPKERWDAVCKLIEVGR